MQCHIRYDTEANAAYIGIGGIRDVDRIIEPSDADDSVKIDLDRNGNVIGIELLGIDEPVLFITHGDRRKPERKIKVRDELL